MTVAPAQPVARLGAQRYSKPPPQPGVYIDVPADEYHSWDALSASCLKQLAVSALNCRWWMDQSDDGPTMAMYFGTVLHMKLLQPELFDSMAVEVKGFKPGAIRTTLAKTRAAHPNRLPLAEGWSKSLKILGGRAKADKETRIALGGESLNEVAVVWRSQHGLPCKALLDRVKLGDDCNTIVDIKTTARPGDDDFGRTCWDLGYDIQAAFYLRAHEAAAEFDLRFRKEARFEFVVMQNDAPYDVGAGPPDEAFLDVGRQRMNELMPWFTHCWANDTWPGVAKGTMRVISLPGWAMARYIDGGMA